MKYSYYKGFIEEINKKSNKTSIHIIKPLRERNKHKEITKRNNKPTLPNRTGLEIFGFERLKISRVEETCNVVGNLSVFKRK